MKFYNRSKKTTILLIALLGFSITGTEVLAKNIKRSCSAHYYGMVDTIYFKIDGRDKKLNIPFETINLSYQDYKFTAEGGCGKSVPNRCRKRARDKLLACAKAYVNSPDQKPDACSSGAIKNHPTQSLRSALKEKACGKLTSKGGIRVTDLLSKPYSVDILVGVFIRGKNDCGKKKPGKTTIDGQRYNIDGNKLYLKQPLKNFKFT